MDNKLQLHPCKEGSLSSCIIVKSKTFIFFYKNDLLELILQECNGLKPSRK